MFSSSNESNNPHQIFLGPAGLRIRVHLRNADGLTSPPSPPVVPIGRGRRVSRPNDVSNSSLADRGVGQGQRTNNNSADDLTSPIHLRSADNLTSPSSPLVVPIRRGRRVSRSNDVSNSFLAGRGVGLGQRINNNSADVLTSPINNSVNGLTSSHNNAVDDSTSISHNLLLVVVLVRIEYFSPVQSNDFNNDWTRGQMWRW